MDFEKLMQEFLDWLRQAAPKLLGAVIILVVGWYLASLVSSLLRKAMQRGRADGGIVSFVYSLTKIALRIIVFISVASQLGVNVNSLIAAIGAAGVTAGLALKDSLSNLASGALIIINKPFHVGDYLETEGLQGTVSRIEIMYTTLVTFDNKEVIIPNARLTANNVTNFTAQKTRRLDLNYTVSYRDDLLQVKALLGELVERNPRALKDPAPIIAVTEHQESGVCVAVKVWCASEDYWTLYFEMQEKVKLAFDEHGITIPFPQMDVHLPAPGQGA